MAENASSPLTFEKLQKAVVGPAAAIRLVERLQPAGGPGDKVFPPTYAGGRYALERRRLNGSSVPCVLLDSVQSQANRLEQTLLRAHEENRIKFPLLMVDFAAEFPDIGKVSTLDASHRIADAIFRDSVLGETSFRESARGKAFEKATMRNATAMFELCPTALIFGVWDSTGSEGGFGNKFARVLTSEIVGFGVETGVKTASRIDVLQISSKVDVFQTKDGGWTCDEKEAKRDSASKPVKYKTGKPSDINHSNVTPDIEHAKESVKDDKNNVIVERGTMVRGGATIDYAEQVAVLSLPGLRRLRFPDSMGKCQPERDQAARTVLAALALGALSFQSQQGYDLRSRCLLVAEHTETPFELVASKGQIERVSLRPGQAVEVFQEAVKFAKKQGLPWSEEPMVLQPKRALVELIRRSRQVGLEEES
jgi:CRISPR-associated protein Csb1